MFSGGDGPLRDTRSAALAGRRGRSRARRRARAQPRRRVRRRACIPAPSSAAASRAVGAQVPRRAGASGVDRRIPRSPRQTFLGHRRSGVASARNAPAWRASVRFLAGGTSASSIAPHPVADLTLPTLALAFGCRFDHARRNRVAVLFADPTVGLSICCLPHHRAHNRRSRCQRTDARDRERSWNLGSREPARPAVAVRVGRRDRARDLVRASLDDVVDSQASGRSRATAVPVAGSAECTCGCDWAGALRARRLRGLRGRPVLHGQLRSDVRLRDLLGGRSGVEHLAW
jgi:hypothetical protein